MNKEKILVSACLLGTNCKYNGKNNRNEKLIEYLKDKEYISICPETFGGMSTPRLPSEIECGKSGEDVIKKVEKSINNELERNDYAKVYSEEGGDVTGEFLIGAQKALDIALENGVSKAILKESSPSCGVNCIYAGKFDGNKKKGQGVTTALFRKYKIEVISEKDL
ncbi:DUF523 domain-containing protein [Peptostreptococcus russellii]|uniref:DUF523 domain-containing protein n=1 Tax=Peptostreptococcus russellii TaxID=215200 RepID=UPI003F5827C4